jgi:GNAT superfamily N-acetyltransferase
VRVDLDLYTLVSEPPTLDDYLRLREVSGLTPKRAEQAGPALANSWAWRSVRTRLGETVAMGRVVGDGGWYFLVADMATLPDHQQRGLGRAVLTDLLDEIRDRAPDGAFVTLMADLPGQRLYEQLGFERPTNGSITMSQRLR